MSTELTVLPTDLALPAHLLTPEAQAAIAAANASAGGGIKVGGFPRISIKGGKFHLVKGGVTTTIVNPPEATGAPPLPKMLLQVVVVAANPALTKTYYPGKYQEGDDGEPTCSSSNGQQPDPHIAAPQSSACSTCEQNKWGSKISEASGKEIKACSDSKQLVILPAENLAYDAYGLSVTASALTAWGKYIKALTDKGIPFFAVVTNVMFDSTAAYPKLVFSFGRLLTTEEYAKVQARIPGRDVQDIVAPTRSVAVPVPLLPSQVTTQTAVPATTVPVQEVPAATAPAAATPTAAAPVVAGFGAAPVVAPTPPAQPPAMPEVPAEAPKRTRAKRTPDALGTDLNFAGLPPYVEPACRAAGPPGTEGFNAVFKQMAGKDYNAQAVNGLGQQVTDPALFTPPAAPAVVQPPATAGFGAPEPAAPAVPPASPAVVTGANDLAAKLKAKLDALKKA